MQPHAATSNASCSGAPGPPSSPAGAWLSLGCCRCSARARARSTATPLASISAIRTAATDRCSHGVHRQRPTGPGCAAGSRSTPRRRSPVATCVGHAPRCDGVLRAGRSAARGCARTGLAGLSMAPAGRCGVGEGDLAPGGLAGGQTWVGEQGLERRPAAGPAAGEPGRRRPRRRPVPDDRGRPARLPLVWACSENESATGRPAVVHPGAHLLPAVQVAQGHVVDAVEHLGGHGRHAADADVALAVAGQAPRHEGMGGQHDRVPVGRVARSARTASAAACSTPWCDSARRRRAASAARRARGRAAGGSPPVRARRPSMIGSAHRRTSARTCTRACSSSRLRTPAGRRSHGCRC